MPRRGGNVPVEKTFMRLLRLALHLGRGGEVTTAYIQARYGVSHSTAKRDLLQLECALPVTVTEVKMPGPHAQKVLRLDPPHRDFVPLLRAAAGD